MVRDQNGKKMSKSFGNVVAMRCFSGACREDL
ncbi:hypothetical protein ABZW51_33750 [Streptomyces cellulosae]